MMVNVPALMADGYAFTCAMCVRLWRGKASGHDCCEAALQGQPCGGPMTGMSFPHYSGPLTREARLRCCFRCGNESDAAIQVGNEDVTLSVCNEHLGDLERLRASAGKYRTNAENKLEFKV